MLYILYICNGHTRFFAPDIANALKLENVFVKHYAPNHMPDP